MEGLSHTLIQENSDGIDAWLNDAIEDQLTDGLMTITDAARNTMYRQTRQMLGTLVDYKELMRCMPAP